MKQKELTFAEKYRANLAAKQVEAEIVDVKVPSGSIFKFQKPSKFSMLFAMGNLPISAVSAALPQWQAEGVGEAGDASGVGQQDQIKLAEMMFKARDRVLALSVEPKIVVGIADESKGELSAEHIADTDLAFLFNWVLSGGDMSLTLNTFPAGSESGPVAKPNRTTRRAASKRSRGNKG